MVIDRKYKIVISMFFALLSLFAFLGGSYVKAYAAVLPTSAIVALILTILGSWGLSMLGSSVNSEQFQDAIWEMFQDFCEARQYVVSEISVMMAEGIAWAANGAIKVSAAVNNIIADFKEWIVNVKNLTAENTHITSAGEASNVIVAPDGSSYPYVDHANWGTPSSVFGGSYTEDPAPLILTIGDYYPVVSNGKIRYLRLYFSSGQGRFVLYEQNKSTIVSQANFTSSPPANTSYNGYFLMFYNGNLRCGLSFKRTVSGSVVIGNSLSSGISLLGSYFETSSTSAGSINVDYGQDAGVVLNGNNAIDYDQDYVISVPDVVAGVQSGAIDTTAEGSLADALSGAISGYVDQTIAPDIAGTVELNPSYIDDPSAPNSPANPSNKFKNFDLSHFFPFCIPFDLIGFFGALNADPVAPHFQHTLKVDRLDLNYTFDLDLSEFDEVAEICRACEFILFCMGLVLVTRDLIKG